MATNQRTHKQNSSFPVWKFAPSIALAAFFIGVANLAGRGVGGLDPLWWTFYLGKKFGDVFKIDPYYTEYVQDLIPLFFDGVVHVYDIPIFHLIGGFALHFIGYVLFLTIAFRVSKSLFLSVALLLLIIGLIGFVKDGLSLPINGMLSPDLDKSITFSHRLVTLILGLSGVIAFFKSRFAWCGILIGLGCYAHPLNAVAFIAPLWISLLLTTIFGKDIRKDAQGLVSMFFGFLIITSPYVWAAVKASSNSVDSPFTSAATLWEFGLQTHPDLVSLVTAIFFFENWGLHFFIVLCITPIIYFFARWMLPSEFTAFWQKSELREAYFPAFMATPFVVVGIAIFYETYLILSLPPVADELILSLHMRRWLTLPHWLGLMALCTLPIMVGMRISRLPQISDWVSSNEKIKYLKKYISKVDIISSLVLAAATAGAITINSNPAQPLANYLKISHENWRYFQRNNLQDTNEFSSIGAGYLEDSTVSNNSLIAVCEFLRTKTDETTAIINPIYIRGNLRACSKRQMYATLGEDYDIALTSRKLLGHLFERIRDLTGLELTNVIKSAGGVGDQSRLVSLGNGRKFYPSWEKILSPIRDRYLDLLDEDIMRIRSKYYGYDYFLTESTHFLGFPRVFDDGRLIIYDIRQSPQK